MGAPHGAASPPPRRARPAQSARPPRPQRSLAPRGAGAGRQRGRGPAGARARPMVPGVPAPRSPLPRSFSASTEKEEEAGKKREMIKLLEAGSCRSPEAKRGRARARGGRWKLPPRRPGGGEEKEGFGGNEGDLKSRPAVALHLLSSPRRAALCCPMLPPAGRSRSHSLGWLTSALQRHPHLRPPQVKMEKLRFTNKKETAKAAQQGGHNSEIWDFWLVRLGGWGRSPSLGRGPR